MRKWLLLIAVLNCFTGFSQTFTVGSTCCNYNYVNYSLKQTTAPPVIFSSRDSFPIDIDGDLLADLVVRNYINIAHPANKSDMKQIYLTSSANVESIFSVCTFSTPFTNTFVLTNIPYGSYYNSISNWDTLKVTGRKTAMLYNYFYNWTIPVGTLICGQQTNPFYIAFRKILPTTDTIYGWIRMDSNFPGKVIDYAYTCGTYTGTPPTSTIITAPNSICKGDSLLLSANPAGGVFFGAGVTGNYFKTKNLAAGVYTVSYAIPNPSGCTISPSSVIFTVNPTNTVAINILSSALPSCSGQPVILIANGANTYTWSNGAVSPSIAVSPTASIVYSVNATSSLACTSGQSTFTQTIIQPTFAVSATNPTICPGTTTQLVANGALTYTWSTGSIGSLCIINPTISTTYSVVATFSPGCIGNNLYTQVVSVPVLNANVSSDSICSGVQINLNASGANTYLWSNGCNNASCSDFPLTSTTYSVVGFGYGNCSDTVSLSVYVNSSNLVLSAVSNQSLICAGDTAILTLSGAAVYDVQGGTEFYSTVFSTVAIVPQSTTTYYIYGNYFIGGCVATGVYTQSVSACVGIHEVDNFNSTITIYPNPNNGEFEIKGLKEETIFISNELGQLIATKNLTQENNYSVKLSNLQSGVYFVGNKLSRLKVVVIK